VVKNGALTARGRVARRALPREQMPFEATRFAGGLERKRQDLWSGN
jgi:hypothetical protein